MFRRGNLKTSRSQLGNKVDLPKVKDSQGLSHYQNRMQSIP